MSSWGRLNSFPHKYLPFSNINGLLNAITDSKPGIAFGNGRSYGDACLNPDGFLWPMQGLDHLIAFDRKSGILKCEAGVLLRDILALVVPEGWILPVTPGTQLITVGGAIANDVHGKNHHLDGSFADHVRRIKLVRTDGEILEIGPNQNKELFEATVGGIGLTGVIVEAEIQLKKLISPWLEAETIPYS